MCAENHLIKLKVVNTSKESSIRPLNAKRNKTGLLSDQKVLNPGLRDGGSV